MDKDTEKRALKALERQTKTYKRQNEWIAANYERQTVTLPQGTKSRIKALTNESVNGFVNRLIIQELERLENAEKP